MGKLVLIPVYVVLTSLLFPDTVLRITAEALFGPIWGNAGVALGSMLGSLLHIVLARPFTKHIERLLGTRPTMRAIKRVMLRDGFRLQLLIRLAPVNHAAVTYVLGAAGIRPVPLLLALPAMLPSIALEFWMEHIGRHVVRVEGSAAGKHSMTDMFSYVGQRLIISP